MASQMPDLLSDSPPPELLSESTHSELFSSPSSSTHRLPVRTQGIPTSSPRHYEQIPALTPPPRAPSPSAPSAAAVAAATSAAGQTPSQPSSPTASGFLSYPSFSRMASSLTRRLTDTESPFFGFRSGNSSGGGSGTGSGSGSGSSATASSLLDQPPTPKRPVATTSASASASLGQSAVFQPPNRTASPFAPPPLTPLTLTGMPTSSRVEAHLLSKTLAEEIRLLLPPRLQLTDNWKLAFGVERDGVSLHTLYAKCAELTGPRARGGYVLVVRDGGGSIFGAYLTDAPHLSSTYYGTGECFLWRASIVPAASGINLANLPPPPSEDTSEYTQRHVTIASPTSPASRKGSQPFKHRASRSSVASNSSSSAAAAAAAAAASGMSATNGHPFYPPSFSSSSSAADNCNDSDFGAFEDGDDFNVDADDADADDADDVELLRFKAFPYSGVNDYLIYCEPDYLSVGGGDGRYGLGLDSSLEKGVSSACMTFGNEPLSEDGEKFEVLGVEVWHVAA